METAFSKQKAELQKANLIAITEQEEKESVELRIKESQKIEQKLKIEARVNSLSVSKINEYRDLFYESIQSNPILKRMSETRGIKDKMME